MLDNISKSYFVYVSQMSKLKNYHHRFATDNLVSKLMPHTLTQVLLLNKVHFVGHKQTLMLFQHEAFWTLKYA